MNRRVNIQCGDKIGKILLGLCVIQRLCVTENRRKHFFFIASANQPLYVIFLASNHQCFKTKTACLIHTKLPSFYINKVVTNTTFIYTMLSVNERITLVIKSDIKFLHCPTLLFLLWSEKSQVIYV